MSNGKYKQSVLRLAALMAILLTLLFPAAALAADGPTLEPANLSFSLQTGDSLTLFTTLNTPVDLTNLTVENNGLVNDAKTANIPPAKVILAPASGDIPTGSQSLAVTIQQPEQPGHYTGQLVLRFGQAPDVQVLPLALDVTVSAAPNVAASAASPNQTLQLRPSFFYLGTCILGGTNCGAAGNQIVITLEQNGPGEAHISELKIDPLRSANNSRPGNVLSATPQDENGQDAAGTDAAGGAAFSTTARTLDLAIRAVSADIPPGAYASGLRVLVADQEAPVVVPFTVNSKAGLFWPALIALLGILVGYFSFILNQRVSPYGKAVDKVKAIQVLLADPKFLQVDEVEAFADELAAIQQRIIGGEDAPAIETALDELKAKILAAQQANRDFVSPAGELGLAIAAMQALPVGKKIAAEIVAGLREIAKRVETGAYHTLADAQNDLAKTADQRKQLAKLNADFQKQKDQADKDREDGKQPSIDVDSLAQAMNEAENLKDLKKAMDQATPKPEEMQFDVMVVPGGAQPEAMDSLRDMLAGFEGARPNWEKFTTTFRVQRAFGVILSAAFALVGGLIALYYPNPTWGASSADYITLAVWALSVNVIAGQSFDFKAQLKPQVQ